MISIALSKGRILDETLPLLKAAGIVASEDPGSSRKLIIATSSAGVRLIIVRATDVPTYVQYGAADLGVAGGDVLDALMAAVNPKKAVEPPMNADGVYRRPIAVSRVN